MIDEIMLSFLSLKVKAIRQDEAPINLIETAAFVYDHPECFDEQDRLLAQRLSDAIRDQIKKESERPSPSGERATVQGRALGDFGPGLGTGFVRRRRN